MSLFRRIINLFLRRDESIAEEQQPVQPDQLGPFDVDDYAAYLHEQRRLRLGADPQVYTYFDNGKRLLEYIGPDLINVTVPQNKQLYFEVLVQGANGETFLIKGGFKTGEQFDPVRFNRIISAKIKSLYPDFENASSFVDNSIKRPSFYFRSYTPKVALQG